MSIEESVKLLEEIVIKIFDPSYKKMMEFKSELEENKEKLFKIPNVKERTMKKILESTCKTTENTQRIENMIFLLTKQIKNLQRDTDLDSDFTDSDSDIDCDSYKVNSRKVLQKTDTISFLEIKQKFKTLKSMPTRFELPYIKIDNTCDFKINPITEYTIVLNIKFNDSNFNNSTIFHFADGGKCGHTAELYIQDNRFIHYHTCSDAGQIKIYGSTKIVIGKWYKILICAKQNGKMQLFVNNIDENEHTTVEFHGKTNNNLQLGTYGEYLIFGKNTAWSSNGIRNAEITNFKLYS